MTVALRPFQATSIEALRRLIASGKRRVLLVLPTGGGKTLTAGAMIRSAVERGKRVLFVAHRKELIDQSVASLFRLGVHPVGVIRAGDRRKDLSRHVQVASIQTLARRPKLDLAPDLIFIDEAHRALAASYREHLYEAYPRAIIIGLSATPCRVDGRPLGDAFDALHPAAHYSELIAGGYIDAPVVYGTPIGPDVSRVHTSGGDFNAAELEEAVNKSALIGNVGAEWARRNGGRITVVFAVSVAHSLALRDEFRSLGVTAEHLDGTTPEGERAAILARLERGETRVVCNVGVLCEGWDCPPVKCLVIARPTKSLSLWMQMAGRILRPHGGIAPLILDHGGNVDRHGLPHKDRDWSLDTKAGVAKPGEPPMRVCKDCFAYVPAGTKACPHCGAERPEHVAERKAMEPVPVDLALRTLEEQWTGDPARIAFWRRSRDEARERGWDPRAVAHRYRGRFDGEEPPAGWMDVLRADYARDPIWRSRYASRRLILRERERAA